MLFNALASLIIVPAVAQLVLAQNQCTRTYTVQDGDICDSISAANHVSTYQLAVVNDGIIDAECSNLVPGNSICLGWQGSDCSDTYVVKLGDDCDEVSYTYGLNSTIFYANNPQLNEECTNLYVGEVVCTASTVIVPPPPASGTLPGSSIPPTSTPAPDYGDLPWCD